MGKLPWCTKYNEEITEDNSPTSKCDEDEVICEQCSYLVFETENQIRARKAIEEGILKQPTLFIIFKNKIN